MQSEKVSDNLRVISREEFAAFSPLQKGYAVYLYGSRPDQPHVPRKYFPSQPYAAAYAAGLRRAVLLAQDSDT